MSFDIPPLHIADNSPEAQVIETIVSRDHVSPGEAILTALRGLAIPQSSSTPSTSKKPGELLFGLFADEPELMQRIAKDARTARNREIVKEFSA